MSVEQKATLDRPAQAQRMQLRYGFNEVDGWWHMSLGEHREQIRRRLRLMDTRVIRIFVFDKPVPDPVTQWPLFAGYVQAVLDAGAVPPSEFVGYTQPEAEPMPAAIATNNTRFIRMPSAARQSSTPNPPEP